MQTDEIRPTLSAAVNTIIIVICAVKKQCVIVFQVIAYVAGDCITYYFRHL